jgi:hypothetical protein
MAQKKPRLKEGITSLGIGIQLKKSANPVKKIYQDLFCILQQLCHLCNELPYRGLLFRKGLK